MKYLRSLFRCRQGCCCGGDDDDDDDDTDTNELPSSLSVFVDAILVTVILVAAIVVVSWARDGTIGVVVIGIVLTESEDVNTTTNGNLTRTACASNTHIRVMLFMFLL